MTILRNTAVAGQPGTHVLVIGVGSYPYLLGGSKKLTSKPMGLRQLQSPPVSAKALIDWLLAPAGTPGFANPQAPLASVAALASSAVPVVVNTPDGDLTLEAASRENMQAAFEEWLDRLKGHADNVGVFYFCGHGLMVADHYLLAEDFGRSNAQPWAQAFDISTTMRAVEREVSGAVYFFIDACREISRDLAMTLGADPIALMQVDLTKKVSRKHVTAIFATGEGELAFAPQGGEVSRFTAALLCALSGYCGIKASGTATWNVDGESTASAVRQLLEYDALEKAGQHGSGKQVSEQMIQGPSVPLLKISTAPKVKVWLDLTPTQRRSLYELYLLSAKGDRVAQQLLNQVFKVELPRGFYEVGARDPAGALPHVIHAEEELIPPMYVLTLQGSP